MGRELLMTAALETSDGDAESWSLRDLFDVGNWVVTG